MQIRIPLYTIATLVWVVLSPWTKAIADKVPALPDAVKRQVDFQKDVEPIFAKRCQKCHGPNKQESGLRLDHRSVLLRGGDSGEPSIQVGKSADSLLVKAIAGQDPNFEMPPEGPRVSAEEIAIVRAWIDQGARMPVAGNARLTTNHWSFQPLSDVAVPSGAGFAVAPANAIDRFIFDRLKQSGLKPSNAAARRVLIRRLYLVTHGMPPTPDQVTAFVADKSTDAWKKVVDGVLKSPRYGERMARHWLDLVRFGETTGFEVNRERPNAWPYRDYVIEAFNADKPYDKFVQEQIAGDAMGADIATGYLVAGPYDNVKSSDINLTLMQRQDELADIINTTGTAFMGLTIGCARCHNHKFDPISQRDYYAVQAVFAGVRHGERTLPIPANAKQRVAQLDDRIKTLTSKLEQFIPTAGQEGPLRPAVHARGNVEKFPPVKAKFVRFNVFATNSSEPCIDELEAWSGDKNVGLASAGTKPTASSELPGYDIHKIVHINDGKYGNGRSWISNEKGKGWIQLEFPKVETIERIKWARDTQGKYSDRVATRYSIQVATKIGEWKEVASSEDREPFGQAKSAIVYSFKHAAPPLARQGRLWLSELEAAQRQRKQLAQGQRVYAGVFSEPGPIHRLYRGDPLAKREVVNPDALEVIGSLDLKTNTPEKARRVAFARWLTSDRHPLVARVIVNRLWQYQFGVGLVDTPSDFGANGTKPSHPRLLDWLAAELIRNKWSLKHIHRLILLSHTWQQDSVPYEKSMQVDSGSRLLWRFPPRRLEAEAIRDSILSVSGSLNLQMGGPGFSAFEIQMENVRHYFPKTKFTENDFRRMIYMTKVRQEQDSTFGAFDCPDASQVMPQRSRSTTPLQALNLLNSEFVVQQSKVLAARIEKAAKNDSRRIKMAFELTYGRPPSADELVESIAFVKQHGFVQLSRAMLNSNEFLFIP